ncbi:hypothetical protein [Flavobacterium anhuiense]|uniref:hypothetical protein n=1 Tax=Flavobacterium anhuiense TaxID=459526 RepID=UPI003D973F08
MINALKTTAISFFIFLNLCFSQEKKAKDVTFKIVDKVLKNNTCAKLLISNNSSYNYYLPILNSPDSETWNFILPSDETSFFFGHVIVYNFKNENLSWQSNNCLDGDLEAIWRSYEEKWMQKKNNIKIEDFILLKAGERKVINVPINLKVKLSNDCLWEIKDYKKEKELKVTYYYRKKQAEWTSLFLDSQILKKLQELNYKLYNLEIESNRVKLIL